MKRMEIDLSAYNETLRREIYYRIPYASPDIKKIRSDIDHLYLDIESNEPEEVENKVKILVNKVVGDYIEYEPTIIYESKLNESVETKDIYQALSKNGTIIEYEDGLIGFGKDFLTLYRYFDNLFLKWAQELGAEEYVYPDIINTATLNQCNYIQEFPSNLLFASHVKEDIEIIEDFARLIPEGDECLSDYFLEKPGHICKSAVCIHVYKQFENQQINIQRPIAITSVGKCKRYESLHMKGLDRLLDFTMREIVFVGSRKYVTEKRQQLMEKCMKLMGELKLEANIKTSNDPFFLNQPHAKALLQNKFKLKYELNIKVPATGKELAAASFNYHHTHFTDAFHIQSKGGEAVHTSCIAFGLERFVYAYLSQKGLEAELLKVSPWGSENVK